MGLPATAFLANNGRYESYPFYVWLADLPDGPIWHLMDRAFDHWDRRTGEHLAFFVDPFQKPEWAKEFSAMMEFDGALTDEVLRASSAAREFYRDRLSMNLARHFRIGREFLPAAIVAVEWNAPSAAVCFLRNADDLERLFETLIVFNNARSPSHPSRTMQDRSQVFSRTREVAQHLGNGFDVQVYEFPRPLVATVREVFEPASVSYFVDQLREKAKRNSWILGVQKPESASGFGLSRAYVALASFDDVLAVAGEIDQLAGRLADRYPGDLDASRLRDSVRRLSDLKNRIDDLSATIRGAIEKGDEHAVLAAFGPFQDRVREFDLVKHLIEVLGARTFGGLGPESRDAIAASELIYLLSLKINDLRRDLTAVLVGYWKASERESRRVFDELLRRSFAVSYEYQGDNTRLTRGDIDRLTLGTLAVVFRGLHLSSSMRPIPPLPHKELGTLLSRVTHRDRNPYTHRRVLNSLPVLAHARNLMGCKNPVGILQLLATCLEQIDPKLIPAVTDEPATPALEEVSFLSSEVSSLSPAPNVSSVSTPKQEQPSIGNTGQWIVLEQRSKKGGFRFRLGTAVGVIHPRSAIPRGIRPGEVYKMRVVTGGDTFQLEWIDEPE